MKAPKNVRKMLTLHGVVRSCFEAGTTAAGCAILLAGAGNAFAADAAPAPAPAAQGSELESITVTGSYQRSLIGSIEEKRNNASIVESVTAEDIGKLPDSSIAEALTRLPGLAGQRLDGRQNKVTVRGFGEDFSATTFNGREQLSISDNRGVEFDLYPSEIMNKVNVYKTPDAAVIVQGIGGTIDMHTVEPLAAQKTVHIGVDYEKNSFGKLTAQAKDSGARGNFTYIDKFADNKVGVALTISTMDSPNQEERWQAWGYANDPSGNLVLGGAKPFVRSSELKRNTFMGVVEFAPTNTLKITGDALYIDFKDTKLLKGIEIPGAEWGGPSTLAPAVNGFIPSGTLLGRSVIVRNDYEKVEAKLKGVGLNGKWEVDKDWNVVGDFSHGTVSRDIWSMESYSGIGRPGSTLTVPGGDNIGFQMTGSNFGAIFSPTVNYADPSLIMLGGPQCWGSVPPLANCNQQDGFINRPHIDDKINSLRLSAQGAVTFGPINGVEFGLNYTNREKSKVDQGDFLTLATYPAQLGVPSQFLNAPTSLGFIGMGNMQTYDSFAMYQQGFYTAKTESVDAPGRALNTWTVTEKVTTAYGKADLESNIGGMPLNGNLGIQVISTDQSSDGHMVTQFPPPTVISNPVSGGSKYTKMLPSLNTVLHLTSDQEARFSLARTLSRSRMDRENASYGYTYNSTANIFTGTVSNPGLRPTMSDQIDLGYNWYFRKDGMFSAALFYKKLTDWQYQAQALQDFSGFVIPTTGQVAPAGTLGLANKWLNSSQAGHVKGAEFQGVFPFAMLSPSLTGLGVSGSAAFLSSSVDIGNQVITVPGLSSHVYNATAYYEKDGFSARISGNQRSDFLGEVAAISFTSTYVEVKQTRTLDAQISFNFDQAGISQLKGLTVALQMQNLTNEPFVTYTNNDPRQVRDHQNYGRDYLLGVRYNF